MGSPTRLFNVAEKKNWTNEAVIYNASRGGLVGHRSPRERPAPLSGKYTDDGSDVLFMAKSNRQRVDEALILVAEGFGTFAEDQLQAS